MAKRFLSLCVCLIIFLCLPLGALANDVQTANAKVSLISEVETVKAGQGFWVAFRFQLREGWHIYWQNPGDSGTKTTLKWQLPKGFSAGEIQFPSPKRFLIPPLANFGYEKEVYLPLQVRSPSKLIGDTVNLRVKADWLICEKECIPESGELSLSLPVGAGTIPKAKSELFAKIQERLPKTLAEPISFTKTEKEIVLNLPKSNSIDSATFFPFQDGIIENAAPQTIGKNPPTVKLKRGYQENLDKLEGVLVVTENSDGIVSERGFNISAQPALAIATEQPPVGFWEAVVLAILGGLILNLMPCVLPILSLHALSIAGLAEHNPRVARLSGLAYTGGVLSSFSAIALTLLTLKAFGQQIGWGFQLQSPVIVLSLVYILFAVGLNLSGVYVFGGGLMGAGQNLRERSGLAGEFFTGVLATIMATPCSAPFMATAIGAALVMPPLLSIFVLLALGFGFALPFLFLCFAPALRKLLPKPGAWLEIFPQVLAFPIYGTAAWMLWVFSQQTGANGLAGAFFGLTLIGFGAWIYGKTQTTKLFWRRIGILGTGMASAIALLIIPVVAIPVSNASVWQPYSRDRLETLRLEGKPVFVNFTAAWCVTCLVNERTTLANPEIERTFAERQIALLKADWTNQDPEIFLTLQKFGNSGVPLYLLYEAKIEKLEPIVLPTTLTPQIVQDTLNQYVPSTLGKTDDELYAQK
jgi:thiol:disulfide interchange protein